jgi:hypothetical protein
MQNLNLFISLAALIWLEVSLFTPIANGQNVPSEVGRAVNGYQDDFDGSALNSGWVAAGANVYSVGSGLLRVSTASGDPNHLLYRGANYDSTLQEVLARIRIVNFGSGDAARGGIATVTSANAANEGINYHFRDEPSAGQRHMEFLDDKRAWASEYPLNWQNNVWYWLRLRHEPDAASEGGGNDVFAKIWPADGSAPEPASWQNRWNYTSAGSSRAGYAGIVAGSALGTSVFDVDYILIKAAGLPSIVAAPAAFPLTQTPVAITNQPSSQIVAEMQPATFRVGASGNPAPTYQWHKNDLPIPGATNATYSIASAILDDNGALFKVAASNIASNVIYKVTSSTAQLTVTPDQMSPVLTGAQSLGLGQVMVAFSERLNPATATNKPNYTLTSSSGAVAISRLILDEGQTNVILEVSPLSEGISYTLIVSGVTDQSAAANAVAANSRAAFTAASYVSQEIGDPSKPGSTTARPGGYDITAAGADIGGTSDQLRFSSQLRTGDFDVKVRLESLELADPWSEAGLMARESGAANSRFAGVLATPTISGCYFQHRNTAGGAAGLSGAFPVNYPNSWLRLKRAGNDFTGYAGYDGQNWTPLGTANISLPSSVLLGFAVASHNTDQTTTAAFRDFSPVSNTPGTSALAVVEPPGQSSRLTSLVISEIMYHPAERSDGKQLEFIELFNTLGTPEEISGYRLAGDVDYTFPVGTIIPGGGFLLVARKPADLQSVYGIAGVLGPFNDANNLPNDNGTVRLRNKIGAVFLDVQYGSRTPWPVAADGAGHSLVLARPSYGENDPRAWTASDAIGGSPGRIDPITAGPLRSVLINEFLAHTDEPEVDYIELYNHSNETVDLSGCVLTDDPLTNRFVLPPSTIIGPRGFLSFTQTQMNFALNAAGETIYFKDAAQNRVLDAVRFGGQENVVATGRYPDGSDQIYRLQAKTPGAANARVRVSDVVINELMYDPITGNDDDQFIELHNRGGTPVNLGGWRLDDGISYTFPTNAMISPNGYLVVARNAARLMTNHPGLTMNNALGNFAGRLSGSGERIVLTMPDTILMTNNTGVISAGVIDIAVDEVTYQSGGRWGRWSNGGGSSLERIDPRADSRLAGNWADSEESRKASWTTVAATGILDNGDVPADQLQVLLQGAGECLIDDVQVLNASGASQMANSNFEINANGWTAEGTEDQSGWEMSEGYNSSRSYRVRAVDRGDNQINRIRTPLVRALTTGTTATIQAKVRWLKGHPEVLFRLRGKWLEAVGIMDLPTNLGTPGAPNSRLVPNAPPAIYEVTHSPTLPAGGQTIVITARAADPDGISSVLANYRIDPAGTFSAINMRDDGAGGDAVAGDGVYSATIPAQAAGTLVAFHVQAIDGAASGAVAVFPNGAPTRECLVRFGEATPAGNLPVYRIWMTRATFNTWSGRSKLNNTPLPVTFVLGGSRVIYDALALYAGSPYISPGYNTPTGNRCGYSISFPEDDKFLGNEDLVLDWPGGHGNENTALQEQMGYWIANKMDLPYSHRYTIRLHVNGTTDLQRGTIFEAVNQPAGDFVRAWSPDDSDGDFYKIDRAFEFSDGGSLSADPQPRLANYTTTGGAKKTARYRFNWLKRSTRSANNYTNIFDLVDAVNAASPEPYTSRTEALVDLEEWMGVLATEHIIVNFDAYGHIIGKNMYAYKPENGKWQLYMFDLDWLMLAATGFSPSFAASSAPLFNCDDPAIIRMYNHPPFLRAYYRAVKKAADGPLLSANCDPVMDAKYRSLVANGVTLCDGNTLANPSAVKNWFSQRRGFLLNQLARVSADFRITSNNGEDFTVNTNAVTLTGTAPIEVKGIRVNGVDSTVAWTSVTNWSMRLLLPGAQTTLALAGYDASGNALTGYTDSIRITSPGSGVPALPLFINEWMAANSNFISDPADSDFEDWFELYNPNDAPVNLAGYSLTDSLADGAARWVIPSGISIPSRGHLLVWADDETGQNTAPLIDLHAPFKLNQSGEAIGLFAPDGKLVDSVTFGAQTDDTSQGRWPDGSTNLVFMPKATPRAQNALPTPEVQIVGAALAGNIVVVTWRAEAGSIYRVQFKADLGVTGWTDLKEVNAVGQVESIADPIGNTQQRFYRIERLAP